MRIGRVTAAVVVQEQHQEEVEGEGEAEVVVVVVAAVEGGLLLLMRSLTLCGLQAFMNGRIT